MLFNQANADAAQAAAVPPVPVALITPVAASMPADVLTNLPVDWQVVRRERTLSFEISSQHTGQRYQILLGLPVGAAPKDGYPSVWALDGMASFPIIETVRRQPHTAHENPVWQAMKRPHDGLIVAIAHASGRPFDIDGRALDYTPFTTADTGDLFSSRHGGADLFLHFITQELRPLLVQHFSLNMQQQTLFGFSYGGLFTLYTLSTQPQHFQRYWAASPSLWFGEHQTVKRLPEQLKKLNFAGYSAKVVITVGLDEQYPSHFSSAEVQAKLARRTMVDNAAQFSQILAHYNTSAQTIFEVQFHRLPAHTHHDMLLHGASRILDFAFAP